MTEQEKHSLIEKIKVFIRENLRSAEILESLSLTFNVNYETFRKYFLWETGESPCQYCGRLRIEHAKTLLRTTDWKIQSIAKECGYSSESSFIRAFRQALGITPNQFRNENLS